MSAIARTLGVSRSNLIERASKPSKPRGPYRKADDVALLAELRPIIDQRPTYGYRRVTALLNRQRRKEGKPTVNTKRVLRVMRQHGLTLQKHTALRPTRTHDGVVVALRSNLRWCSDHLEIHARGLRQNLEKGLRVNRRPPRRRYHPGLAAQMDRRLL